MSKTKQEPQQDNDLDFDSEDTVKVEIDSLQNDDMLDQGYGMYIGDSIKLSYIEMTQLKKIVDEVIHSALPPSNKQTFNVNTDSIQDLAIYPENIKLKKIPVSIELLDGCILIKVGPCDLSGVGGHQVREQIIKDLVNQALQKSNINDQSYETVNVSACVCVRSRLQMVQGACLNNRESYGKHMNAYVKTDKEQKLTHWEPREGPQSFFNDTICAMVISVCTSLFEQGIRNKSISSSSEATQNILKSPVLKEAFDYLISTVKDRIKNLVENVKQIAGIEKMKQVKEKLINLKTEDDNPEHSSEYKV